MFIDCFKGFIHFLFNDFYYIHKGYFKVFGLCFTYVVMLRAFCGRIAGLWWSHIVLAAIDFVLKLVTGFRKTLILGADTLFYLCWVMILSSDFVVLSGSWEGVAVVCCLVENSSGILIDHRMFQVKCL